VSWTSVSQTLTPEGQAELIAQAAKDLQGLTLADIRDRARLTGRALAAVQKAASRTGVFASQVLLASLAQQVAAQVGGLGIFDELLPPNRSDLEEIMLNPDGRVWLLQKSAVFPEAYPRQPLKEEVWRAVEALIAPMGRSISEAQPSVDAKLPREAGMGGARVKVIHPVLCAGTYPAINIRLFEPKPVPPSKIIDWKMCEPAVMEALLNLVGRRYRVLVLGGTRSGKTTFLSALCYGIHADARIVKIEDPEEIWLNHENVVTLEARPALPGSEIPAYTLAQGVEDAMRMSPNWLILGEVRKGDAASALFSAMMSDHAGLTTFHADSPTTAVSRISMLIYGHSGQRVEAVKMLFAQAVDIVVQLGWAQGRRQVMGIWEVSPELKSGDVIFTPLWRPGDAAVAAPQRQRGEEELVK